MAVHIVTDSAADLTDAESEALGVTVVPLSIRFGNEEFVDRRDLTPSEFYAKLAAASVLPETAAPARRAPRAARPAGDAPARPPRPARATGPATEPDNEQPTSEGEGA